MRSAAAAIAWEFRQRHRWGLIALTGYMLVLGVIKLVIVVPGAVDHDRQRGTLCRGSECAVDNRVRVPRRGVLLRF